jgi:hypothetical protein
MKHICTKILLIGISISFAAHAQKLDRPAIEKIVKRMDSLHAKDYKSFSRNKKTIKGKLFKERWKYYKAPSQIYFSIRYRIDSTEYKEEYYFYKSNLIYGTEWEILYFPSLGSGVGSTWAGFYYFSGNKLIYEETLGHGKSESEENSWNPEKETLSRLHKRKSEIKKQGINLSF